MINIKMKLSQFIKQRSASIEQAQEELYDVIRKDINHKIGSGSITIYMMAHETGIIYSTISYVRNKRRTPSKEFIRLYTKWLEDNGE